MWYPVTSIHPSTKTCPHVLLNAYASIMDSTLTFDVVPLDHGADSKADVSSSLFASLGETC